MDAPHLSRFLPAHQQSSMHAPVDSAYRPSRELMLERLENLTLSFMKELSGLSTEDELSELRFASVKLRHVRDLPDDSSQRPVDQVESDDQPDVQAGSTTLEFPRVALKHTVRLAQTIQVALEMHEAVLARTIVTKRDIYYRSPLLFSHQRVVDRLVDTLCATLDAPSASLGVVAASKGLFAGHVAVTLQTGEIISPASTEQGAREALIPHMHEIKALKSTARWVVVVEKEAVFRTLCEKGCGGRGLGLEGNGIIVTGKGYPDASTRRFLWLLQTKFSTLTFYALVDADPSGLDIARCYLLGTLSAVLADGRALALPTLRLLRLAVGDFTAENSSVHLQMTAYDRAKAISLARTHSDTLPFEWKRDLSRMLWTGKKSET